jgi:acetylornithine deacetylase
LVWTWPTEIELLRELVATPSVSGTEAAIGALVSDRLASWGVEVESGDDGVLARVRGKSDGAVLALVSHLDTVPAGEGWSRPPFEPVIEGTVLFGRGSGDAKASVASMMTALKDLHDDPAFRGTVLLLLGYGEETRNTSMPRLASRAGKVDAAVVGEPTNLDVAIAQRGLMMAELRSRGDQRHAGYANEAPFRSSITALATDLARLPGLCDDRRHPVLGSVTVTATMLEAGVSRNVTPPTAKAVLDIRSTPDWTHQELAAAISDRLENEVIITSDRLVPCETPPQSRLLAAARRARPELKTFGSPTCSDWVFLRDCDAIKCGPGTSRHSHTPDERVDLAEVPLARQFYATLAREYLA